jgi:hypothetical protein
MDRSIHEIILDAQSKKYPNIIKKYDDISNVSAVTGDDGAELFQFRRPNIAGEIDPVSGNLLAEYARVSKDNLADYSKRVFGDELPELISNHRFSRIGDSPINGRYYEQMDSPTSRIDPRYSRVKSNGVNENHGWKIHADFVTDLTQEQGLSRAGRAADLSIVDQNLADMFDSRLGGLGVKSDDFFRFYKKAGDDIGQGVYKFADPNDIISAAEVFNEQGTAYKMGPTLYGAGRHVTAYPQSLEARDEITSKLEGKLGNRLVDQNDPAYRLHLHTRDTGISNHPISRGVSARFTTDYLAINPNTGLADPALDVSDAGHRSVPGEYKISGKINPEEINKINKVTQEMPEMAELLHGKDGYISPYKTIGQIAQERSTGKIAPTMPGMMAVWGDGVGLSMDEYNYKGALPSINKPGVTSAPAAAAAAVSAPSVSITNATKVTPLADEYDTGTVAAKISAGEPLTVPPPASPPPKGLNVGTPTDDIRVTPRNRGADSASGGKSKPKAQPSPINTSTQNPKPDPSAKITSNPPLSGEPTLKIGSSEPSKVTTKPKGLMDNGMKTAQDLASGNARAMGIAAAAGLLGVGIAMSNRKRTIAQMMEHICLKVEQNKSG